MTSRSSLLKAALGCFETYPVIAVGPDKTPYRKGWNKYFSQQQTEGEVREQFSNGAWGIAKVLYPACKYVHLDFDGPHCEEAWLKTGIVLPDTARIRTQSGKYHLVFLASDLLRRIDTKAVKRGVRFVEAECRCAKKCGVDFLINGVAVIPPSPGYREEVPLESAVEIPDDVVELAMVAAKRKRNPKFTGKIRDGERHQVLLSIGGRYLNEPGITYKKFVKKLSLVNESRCDPPLEDDELEYQAKDMWARYGPSKLAVEQPDNNKIEFVSMDVIQPEKVDWLWKNRIPLGHITSIEADPGSAKSFTSLKIAAHVSRGEPLPGDSRSLSPSSVLLLSFEDAPGSIIRPRLDSMGANNSKIIIPNPEARLAPSSMNAEFVEKAVKEIGPALVIIDPIVAFGAKRDNSKDSDVREFLQPLAMMAQQYGFACILVRHLNKQPGRKAIYRGSGSIDYVAVARSIFTIAEDPEQEGRRILAHVKNTITAKQPSLSFYLSDAGFAWGEEVEVTADELLQPDESKTRSRHKREEARSFLEEALADGPAPCAKIQDAAEKRRISKKTLWRAKEELEVDGRKQGLHGPWWWRLHGDVRRFPFEEEDDN